MEKRLTIDSLAEAKAPMWVSILLNTVISFLRECSRALLYASSVVEQVEALHSSLVLEIRNKKYIF